jgi:superfamily II RNA helicase
MAKKDIKMVVEKKYPDFADTVLGLSVEDLEKRLSTYAKERDNVREAKENDEKLEEIANLKSELEAPYKDATKAIDLKSRYIIQLIKDKGGAV